MALYDVPIGVRKGDLEAIHRFRGYKNGAKVTLDLPEGERSFEKGKLVFVRLKAGLNKATNLYEGSLEFRDADSSDGSAASADLSSLAKLDKSKPTPVSPPVLVTEGDGE